MPSPIRGVSRRTVVLLGLSTPFLSRAHAAVAVTDALGRPFTLNKPPERILLGFNFEEFTAVAGLGGWDRVVGMNRRQWEVYRPAIWSRYAAVLPRLLTMPDIGDTEIGSFSAERVLSLRPDLLITLAPGYTLRGAEMAQIEAAGIPVLVVDYNAQTVARHVASTLALGQATGNANRAQALATLYADKVAEISRRVEGAPRPRAYVENGSAGPAVFGNTYNGSMWGRMLELAGAANIAAGRIPQGWGAMPPEAVLAAAPEHAFILGASWAASSAAARAGFGVSEPEARRSLAPYADRPGWPTLPAVRAGSLHVIEASLARSLWDWTATEYIAKQVHPDRFADTDPVADLRRYHEQFLPVAFEGTWMARLPPARS